MEKAAEKREDMRKTEQDRSRRRPERRDGNTGRGRAEGYGARKERIGSDRTEIHGRHGQAAGGEFRKQKYDRSAEYLAAADTDGAADGSLRGAMPCSKRSVPARRLTVC